MNDKIIFSLICFFLCSMGIHAQRKIEGNVKDSQTGKNIAFANVILQLQADTTKNYSGSLTDLEGNFSLDNVPTKPYRIVVSYLGYKTIKEGDYIRQYPKYTKYRLTQQIRRCFIL